MRHILEEQRAAGFPAFTGADIKGLIPIRESLLNELVQSRPQKGSFQILAIRIRPRNRIEIDANVKAGPFHLSPTITVQLAPETKVASGQRLTLSVEGAAGLLLRVGSSIAQSEIEKRKLPITISGTQAQIDIGAGLASRGYANIVPMIRRIGFATEPGLLYIDFHIHNG